MVVRRLVPGKRDLRLLVGAVGLSSLGDNLALVPLLVRVEERGGSGLAVAAMFVALWGPAALLAGPAGLLADRVSPRRVLGVTAVIAAAACAALAVGEGLGIAILTLWPAVWLALAGYLFGGVAHGVKNVLAPALIHERAPERVRGRAFAAFNGLRNGAELVALTLGGVGSARWARAGRWCTPARCRWSSRVRRWSTCGRGCGSLSRSPSRLRLDRRTTTAAE